MKKTATTPQERIALQHHRARYQSQQRQAIKGIQRRCECGMLLGIRRGDVWHIHKSDFRMRVGLPCLWLEIDCPACCKTNQIEEYPEQKPSTESTQDTEFLM